jgi:hypothetical protein
MRGWVREPCRWRIAEFKVGDEVVRDVVPTKAEERRLGVKTKTNLLVPEYVAPHELPLWAKGMPYYSTESLCDPRIAVKHEMEEQRGARPFRLRPRRRWRPGRSSF